MKNIVWQDVSQAATPRAALAWADVRPRMLERLRQYRCEDLEQLTLIITADCWVVIGDHALLPWVSGVQYAAPSLDAPELWLPTHLSPDIAPALILQGLKERHTPSPVLLWPSPACSIPLQPQLTLSPALFATLQELLA